MKSFLTISSALTLLLHCQTGFCQPVIPSVAPKPANPILRSPRQAGMFTTVSPFTSYIIASKLISGTNYLWWGNLRSSNVANIVTINMTNTPSAPTDHVSVSWTEPVTIMTSKNLSDWSSAAVTSTRTVVFPNDNPQMFFRTPVSPQAVLLGWDASPDFQVTGYNVYYGSASGSYTNISSVGSNLSWIISGLQSGATYYFAVTAYDGSGLESVYSNEVNYTVPTNDVPSTIKIQ